MTDTKRFLELALKGLEIERAKIEQEIAEVQKIAEADRYSRMLAPTVKPAAVKSNPKHKGTLTAAGRRKLSEVAKRRWIAGRKLGKTTL